MADREAAYVAASSRSAWELAVRHVWTLERGLRVVDAFRDDDFVRLTEVRDETMAENVRWLREWTGRHANHTMRGAAAGGEAARMGQHLTEAVGPEYYSLAMQFGSGRTTRVDEGTGETVAVDLAGPLEGTLEERLARIEKSSLFLDFDAARVDDALAAVVDEETTLQFDEGENGPFPATEPSGTLADGVAFVREVSPATIFDRALDPDP